MAVQGRDMNGRVVLVTGGTSGMGHALCQLLAERGANLVINWLYEDENPDAVREEIEQLGAQVLMVKADVTNREQVQAMVTQAIARFGRIDGLSNTVGGMVKRVPFLEVTPDLWQKTLDLNLTTAFHVSQAVIPHMVTQQYGRIVNISSIAHRHGGGEGSLPYAAAKAGILAMTKGLSIEFIKSNILVNAVVPGPASTRFFRNDQSRLEGRMSHAPMGRIGTALEMAEVIAFLLSDAASFVTGAHWEVAGGF